MKPKALALWLFCLLMAPPWLRGDGCFIPPTAFAKVQSPDQRALIHFDQGTETLVIDTAFKGDGTNFAWIVPVPSAPKVGVATPGLFPTLQTIFQPKIIHYVPHVYWGAVLVGAFIFSILWTLRRGGSIFLGVLLIWLLGLFLFGGLLPAASLAGPRASPTGQVNVIERKTVGIYDTAVLSSRDGGALLDWLDKNGFVTPTNYILAIRAYAQEGWFFVASKIRLDASLVDAAKPSPLALTFKTDRPVYPLRLTGIGNENCRIDLYIFGPGRANLPNFAVERCAQPLYPDMKDSGQRRTWRFPHDPFEHMSIRHPLLRALVDQSPVATKLTARLNSRKMKEDAFITWSPFQEKRLKFYSEQGAAMLTTNITVILLVVALLAWSWTDGYEGVWPQRVRKASIIAVLGSVLLWPAVFLSLPKIPVVVRTMPESETAYLQGLEIPQFLGSKAWRQATKPAANFTPDIAWVRQQLAETSDLRRELGPKLQTNFFSGQPWHEEDSPGNYAIRQTAQGIEYLWYDIEGGENVVPLFR